MAGKVWTAQKVVTTNIEAWEKCRDVEVLWQQTKWGGVGVLRKGDRTAKSFCCAEGCGQKSTTKEEVAR